MTYRSLRQCSRSPTKPLWCRQDRLPLVGGHLATADYRLHLSILFLLAALARAALATRPAWRQLGLFVLIILGSVVAFGYFNVTRHCLILVTFLSTYLIGNWRRITAEIRDAPPARSTTQSSTEHAA